ncbi:MAG: hypothetical protein EOO38_02935 [Cytophagaceae bacterium]|nr:MAG: hypothetical protein EOO38_02935 [Cytophagaceae bacterium]
MMALTDGAQQTQHAIPKLCPVYPPGRFPWGFVVRTYRLDLTPRRTLPILAVVSRGHRYQARPLSQDQRDVAVDLVQLVDGPHPGLHAPGHARRA